MNNIKAVLFDLDGTLLYTLPDLAKALNFTLKKYNFPTLELDEVMKRVGNGVPNLIKYSLPDGADTEILPELVSVFKAYYAEHTEQTAPYEGIIPLLEELKKRGIKTGVLSNKYDTATKELCGKHFWGLISYAQGALDGVRPKPYPELTEIALKNLGVKADETLYVGDSEVDVETARFSHLKLLCVLWGYRDKSTLLEAGAENFINKPSEIANFII